MENFKVTNVDGNEIAEANVPLQEAPIEDAQPQGLVEEKEQFFNPDEEQKIPESGNEAQAENQPEETNELPREEEEINFAATTIDFDEKPADVQLGEEAPKVEGSNLLDFIESNNDLIKSYNALDRDFDSMENDELIKSHLLLQYPDLSSDDIDTLVDDFGYDEEEDSKAEIVRKKIALQKAVADAKTYLTGQKEQLHQELATRNLGAPTTQDNKAAEAQKAAVDAFQNATNEVFNEEFEGFDFKIGDGKGVRIKINNVESIKNHQSDIGNIINRYFDQETGQINDAAGYHRAMFAASNVDALAEHFYQQGKADAISNEAAEAKNINMSGRQDHSKTPTKGATWKLSSEPSNNNGFMNFK